MVAFSASSTHQAVSLFGYLAVSPIATNEHCLQFDNVEQSLSFARFFQVIIVKNIRKSRDRFITVVNRNSHLVEDIACCFSYSLVV